MDYALILFVLNFLFTILVYLWARAPKFSDSYAYLPNKYIVKNKHALSLFIFPVKKLIPKWNFALLIIQYITFLITLILGIIYFIDPNIIPVLDTKYSLMIYSIWFLLYFLPIGIINTALIKKYTK